MVSNFRQHKIFFTIISRAICGDGLDFVTTPKCQKGANLSPILSFEIFKFYKILIFTIILVVNLKIIFGLVFVKILSSIFEIYKKFLSKIFFCLKIFLT